MAIDANSTSVPARRGFLRNLAALPLIGGGLTLIGNPTAAAEPVSKVLLDSYETWLFYERRWLRYERYGAADTDHSWDRDWSFVPTRFIKEEYAHDAWDGVRIDNPGGQFHGNEAPAMTRAAVVLAAAGCNWRKGDR